MISPSPSAATPPTTSPHLGHTLPPHSPAASDSAQTPVDEVRPCPVSKLTDDDENASHGSASMHLPPPLKIRDRLRHFNGMLVFFMLYMALCAFNYGFDVGTFSGVQGMDSFTRRFGEYNELKNRFSIPPWLLSIMTATPFLGKAVGCIICGPIAEKWGRKFAIFGLCILSFIGVTLQTSAASAAQFTVGRIFTFAMTGMTIVVVPIFQAEASPRVLRGMFGSTLQAMVIFGQVVSTLVTYGTETIQTAAGWRIPIGLQFIAPCLLCAMLYFLPESPRWLLSHGRREEAIQSLAKFRKRTTVEEVGVELNGIALSHHRENQGTWAEVFNQENRLRTGVATLAMFGQQITGQAFASQYAVVFYQSQGFGASAFLFNVLNSVISLVAVMITWLFVDSTGRRPVLLVGGAFMSFFFFLLGGIGSMDPGKRSDDMKNLMVACLMLFYFFYNLSWAPVSYIVVSEVAAQRVREKTNLFACVISVLTTFVTSYTIPYLISDKGANLGAKVGYIYGSTSLIMIIVTYFFIPELKGRQLEEVDQLFASGLPLRRFGKIPTRSPQEVYRIELERQGHLEEEARQMQERAAAQSGGDRNEKESGSHTRTEAV
ncbi:General substrate transporter [Cordyceps fumosorosea ARSEF 2679]|uniref:General substrate transporter n=1 Tax=Cordyceps fumosorosea (strain ARSEF 2679) TaxID=1081104 RepID=A0A162MXQ3_CORFA|nr:General substrate transporter [Cordyceps fumosorosea ARSEF 2679]OAA72309.1 General substrate transporter [Cordyceps fumosorosea ARSEF 2679]